MSLNDTTIMDALRGKELPNEAKVMTRFKCGYRQAANCLEALREELEAGLDAAITSPPYGVDALGHSRGNAEKRDEIFKQGDTAGAPILTKYGNENGQLDTLPQGTIDTALTSNAAKPLPPVPECPVIQWEGCYDQQWKGIITDGSFCHPAKMSRGLLRRILARGFEQGWWRKGSKIGDCFGGIGTTAIEGTYAGLRVVSCEIEPKFVKLGHDNLALHAPHWRTLGLPLPSLLQGDSRQFDHVIEDGGGSAQSGETTSSKLGRSAVAIDAAVSSPPYATIAAGAGGLNHLPAKEEGQQSGRANGPSQDTDTRYGGTEGQIAGTREETLEAAITSPPWEDGCEGGLAAGKLRDPLLAKRGNGASDAAVLARCARDKEKTYGDSPGQIGKEQKESYWQAVRSVYEALYRCLKPGGISVLVVKDYVRDKKRVRLCDDTLRLLCWIGFEPVERIHAMLVHEEHHGDFFDQSKATTKKERKSFFRRLHEGKLAADDERRIDWEECLVVRKPL